MFYGILLQGCRLLLVVADFVRMMEVELRQHPPLDLSLGTPLALVGLSQKRRHSWIASTQIFIIMYHKVKYNERTGIAPWTLLWQWHWSSFAGHHQQTCRDEIYILRIWSLSYHCQIVMIQTCIVNPGGHQTHFVFRAPSSLGKTRKRLVSGKTAFWELVLREMVRIPWLPGRQILGLKKLWFWWLIYRQPTWRWVIGFMILW